MFDAAVSEVIRNLISGTTIACWNEEQLFQVTDIEVGHAPSANLPCSSGEHRCPLLIRVAGGGLSWTLG
jgi:hypothetical protein